MNRRQKFALALVALLALLLPAGVAITPAEAGPIHACGGYVVKDTAGPGLKNYRAHDPYCNDYGDPGKWWGPWRYTKSGAYIDLDAHWRRIL